MCVQLECHRLGSLAENMKLCDWLSTDLSHQRDPDRSLLAPLGAAILLHPYLLPFRRCLPVSCGVGQMKGRLSLPLTTRYPMLDMVACTRHAGELVFGTANGGVRVCALDWQRRRGEGEGALALLRVIF